MVRLGVNVDHVATVRQARRAPEPDPVTAAALAELAGADQITVHLREDRRHIQDRDVRILRETVQTMLNLEMACAPEIVQIACGILPDMCTLVPEKRQELTTEGGLDVIGTFAHTKDAVQKLKDKGIIVSLFIAADHAQIEKTAETGATAIELHTGTYAEAKGEAQKAELIRLTEAAAFARSLGLTVNAGHGLNYINTAPVIRIPELHEVNIGHSIISRAVLVGLERAVREMKELIRDALLVG